MRLTLALCLVAPALSACVCVPPGVKADFDTASAVFRGVVTNVRELPVRPDVDRPRYAVTFLVSEYWKGVSAREVTLHVMRPGTDCVGARFDLRTEYVVFATSKKADDYRLGGRIWYGWLDLMPAGTEFLTVNNYCDSTALFKDARKTIRALGKGKKPSA